MSNETDASPRPKLQVTAEPDSPLVVSPSASPASRAAFETPDDHRLTHESFQAILSSQQRAGRWEASDEIDVRAICGEVVLDFTRAELPPSGVIEIEAWAIAGNVEIILPDGAEVEIEGTPILGSIEQDVRKRGAREAIREWVTGERDADIPRPPAAVEPPFFRIDCHAIAGTVKVTGR